MPQVVVRLLEGRTLEQKRMLVEKVTQAVCESVDVPAERVSIQIQHMPLDDFARAGKLVIDEN